MIRFLLVLPLLLAGTFGWFLPPRPAAEPGIPLCYTAASATSALPGDMRQFALDPAFQALHPAPLPLHYAAVGENISFATPDGQEAQGYLIKAKKKSDKWLFVYQEWWGLNDYIRKQADTFYTDLGENVNVLALDMYDGQVATTPQEAGKLLSGTKEERLVNIVKGALAHAGPKAQVANVGWCFGGSWSLRSGLLGGKNTVGTVMYYGMPVQDVEQLKTLNGDVLGLFATEERISKQVIENFDANMKQAGKTLTYRIFPGVHGFANPSNAKYDEKLAAEAYGMALPYLKKRLKV